MKILIIGNTSTVAKRLFENLKSKYSVFTAGRNDFADVFIDFSTGETNTKKIDSVDIVINCAASFLNNSVENAIINEKINSVGSLMVCELAQNLKAKKIIQLSSISCYDKEENEYFGFYGLSKKHADENIELFCRLNKPDCAILRFSQIYDKNCECKKHQPFLYNILDKAKNNEQIIFWGNKDVERNYIYIDDVVNIIEKIIEKNINGLYPCVYPKTYKISEIADIALKIFNNSKKREFLQDKPNIKTVFIPNDTSIYELIDYYPQINIETGFEEIKNAGVIK